MANIELTNSVLVQKIAHQEIANGCDPDHIAVGGYNEGLDVALLAALCIDQRIRGILAITDDLGRKDGIPEWRKPANAKTPLFVVDYSGKNNNASEKLLASIEQPVGALCTECHTPHYKLDCFLQRYAVH